MTQLRALAHICRALIPYRQPHRSPCRSPWWAFLLAMTIAGLGVGGEAVHAQSPAPVPKEARSSALEEQWRAKLNANPVAIMAGSPNETYLSVTHDLAVLLNGDDLRILPIAGLGGAQNIRDVLFLRGIDAGITSTHMLRYFASTGELSAALDQRLDYITKLFVEEMHVVARRDIADIEGLSGKRVNFSDEGSTTQITARDVFGLLSIKVQEVNVNQADALEKLKSGEIAATVLFSGKPVNVFALIPAADNLHLLTVPFTSTLENTYVPAELEADVYPNLIAQAEIVRTIGVDAVLIATNSAKSSEGYRRLARFVDAFFSKFSDLRKPRRHPKWREVNLSADLPGWQRFPAAQEWLDRAKAAELAQLQVRFEQFLSQLRRNGGQGPLSEEARRRMFRDFLEWSAQKQER